MSTLLERIEKSFAEIDSINHLRNLVESTLAENVTPEEIVLSMRKGLVTAGRKYEEGQFFLSDLIMSGLLAQEVSNILSPRLAHSEREFAGRVVIGTVKGDIHDLGKNLVSMMLSSAGFEIVDLGVDVTSERFVEAVRNENPSIAAMSCLLTSAMDEMKNTINRMERTGVRGRVKVVIGGRPISPDFAKEIGADGYGEDAIQAVDAAKNVMSTGTRVPAK